MTYDVTVIHGLKKQQEKEEGLDVGQVDESRQVGHREGWRNEEEGKGGQGEKSHGKLPGVVRAKGETG